MEGEKSWLCYLGRALMENCNSLAVNMGTTPDSGTAQRDGAKAMVARAATKRATLGVDKRCCDVAKFVHALREQGITPRAAQKKGGAIDARTPRHVGYTQSLRRRELVEKVLGCAKAVGGLRNGLFIGLAKVKAQAVFTLIAYDLMRMATIFGWRLKNA